ncbi:MAG: hypothetical protein Ct9H90mP16_11050 [Candidatus Poseidoniales archaeon]|nr:MAG: hypothetical protein Ct9H90mP16_11050 [Candidatus Poseidoniales archaeon]
MSQKKSDVLIVGAGPGGLTTAMMLAKAGVSVTILEKSDGVGGRTRVFEKDGYKFDNGPTFFHYPEISEEVFKSLGRDVHEELNLIQLDPNYRLVFGSGGSLNVTSDLDSMTSKSESFVVIKMRMDSKPTWMTIARNSSSPEIA